MTLKPEACQHSFAKGKNLIWLCVKLKSTYQHIYDSLTNMLYLVFFNQYKSKKVNLVNLR